MINKIKSKKGITLISLVATIIILMILAGVSLNVLLGEDGILSTAKRTKIESKIAEVEEKANVLYMNEQIEEVLVGKTSSFIKVMNKLNEEYDIEEETNETITIAGITLDNEELTIVVNASYDLTYEIVYNDPSMAQYYLKLEDKYYEIQEENKEIRIERTPTNISGITKDTPNIEWKTDADKIVAVADGRITGKGEGTATITVKEKNSEKEATCVVTVNLAVNDEENPQEVGTIVQLPNEWALQPARYVSTQTGMEVVSETKVATVYAVAIGDGISVPVPYGFYYVGGNLSSGVIISDNEEDKYVSGTDKTTYAYTTSLKGNQFVWIPCTTSEYHKKSWGSSYQTVNWDDTTPEAELIQIEKYGGFYVARYEAGLASTLTVTTVTQTHTGSNQVYNLDGAPQSKAGIIPWSFIDWTHSKANAKKMYNNSYVSSGLITGTQWDVILNKMIQKNAITSADATNSSGWGNYRNTQLNYTGRLAKAYSSGGKWYLPVFGSVTTGTTGKYNSDNTYGDLLTTGASSKTEKYHIFDIAGNLWEWTEEDSHSATSGQYRMIRAGSCDSSSSARPACFRGGVAVSGTDFSIGFREVLYMK